MDTQISNLIPLALSAPGWTAIGAIGGALVGATAGAGTDAIFQRRKQRHLAKAGARLISGDLQFANRQLQDAQLKKKWWAHYTFHTANWEEYRGTLAAEMTQRDFEAISGCVVALKLLFDELPAVPNWPPQSRSMNMPQELLASLDANLAEIESTKAVLNRWS